MLWVSRRSSGAARVMGRYDKLGSAPSYRVEVWREYSRGAPNPEMPRRGAAFLLPCQATYDRRVAGNTPDRYLGTQN